MWERNVGRDGLTDYEYLLDKDQLYAHIEKEAHDLWPVKKGRDVAYDERDALTLLVKARRPCTSAIARWCSGTRGR